MPVGAHVEAPLLVAAFAGEPDAFAVFGGDGGDAAFVAVGGDEGFRGADFEVGGDGGGVDVEFVAV